MATQENTEVKDELDGVLTADDLEDPTSNDVGDAIVEDPENAPLDEETETPTDSSTETKAAEGDEPEESGEADGDEGSATDPETKTPKDVPGETPREKALRLELERKRAQLRELRGQKMFGNVSVQTTAEELTEEDKKVLEQFDPEQVANMEKLLAVQAKKMGFVKKDEFSKNSFQEQAQSVLDDWLEAHPVYNEDNDPDGVLWKEFQREYSQYRTPQNPKELTKIFNRIHKDLYGIETDTKPLKQVEAKQEKIKVASHGGTTGASSTKQAPTIDAETQQMVKSGALKGFSDEDLAELGLK
jgi:hypothetical protein